MAPAQVSPPPSADNVNLSERLLVERSPEKFGSRAVSLVNLPAGSLFMPITTATPAKKAYSSVQVGPDQHIELNSDLVFCNHSCDPSLIFNMQKMEVRVVPHRDLKVGEPLTFFYPTTEWDMGQPFQCKCGAAEGICKGWIDGAQKMDEKILRKYILNDHIEKMLSERAANGAEGGSKH